jgi:hypothetical protein
MFAEGTGAAGERDARGCDDDDMPPECVPPPPPLPWAQTGMPGLEARRRQIATRLGRRATMDMADLVSLHAA